MGNEEGVVVPVDLVPADYENIVVYYAKVCHSKLKKPTIFQVDDLINEGMIILLKAISSFDPSRGFPFEPFLKKALSNSLGILVKCSYRRSVNQQRLDEKQVDTKTQNNETPSNLFSLVRIPEQLTTIECEYLQKMLDPSDFIQQIVGLRPKKIQKTIREHLGLTTKETKQIESNIIKSIW